MSTYRIAMVAACPFPYPRGTPTRVLRMAQSLAERGHEIHVVTYHLGEPLDEARFRVHRIPRVPTYTKASPGPTYQKLLLLDLLLANKLRQVIQRHPVDVVHVHHYEGLLAALMVRPWLNAPIVYDAHTLLSSELPYYNLGLPKGVKRWLGAQLDRSLPKRANFIVTVTKEICQFLLSGIRDPDTVTIIPSGVEFDHFDVPAQQHCRTGKSERRLIYAGNLAAYQEIGLLLEAFAGVLERLRDVRLEIVTDSDFAPFERRSVELGIRSQIDVIRADFEQLPKYLGRASVAVNPRIHCDGIPQKNLNYMAAGIPIVSFAGSAKGLVDDETALIVSNGDVDGFVDAIVSLLAEPERARSMAERGRDLVRKHYSWMRVAELTEEVYQRLVDNALPSTDAADCQSKRMVGRARRVRI